MSLRALFWVFGKVLKAFAENIFRWDRYERRNVGANPCDLRTAKHFMESIVRGCSAGRKGASMYTMLQKWTDFGAGWKRRSGKIPSEVSESVYFV